jgi:DNA-binding NarL/FixJ family response regulator
MAMRFSPATIDESNLLSVTTADGFAAGVHEVLRKVVSAIDAAEAVDLLAQGAKRLGATSSCFISLVREAGDALGTYRMLLACDARWGTEYVANGWFDFDPWLNHALRSEEPVLASTLSVETRPAQEMVARATALGFRSTVVAPSPSAVGSARVGVLYIGSDHAGYFDNDGYKDVRPLAQALAMELHGWWLRALRRELTSRIRLTDADLELLRHQEGGRSSKAIEKALGVPAKTIDCRFQRINAKLGASSRKGAARIAKLYGLL